MKKEKIKGIIPYIKIISFVLVFAILIEGLSLTVFSNSNAANYKNKYSNAMSFYEEKKNSIQIAAVGNSDLYSGFCPDAVWNKQGFTSNAIGAPRQTPARCYMLLQDFFKNQSPDIVIIECDMLYTERPNDSEVVEKNPADMLFDNLQVENFDGLITDKISIFTFHDKWKRKKSKKKNYKTHGYRFNKKVVPVNIDNDFMKKTDIAESILPYNKKTVERIIAFCREKGADVILTTFPSPVSWSYERHNAVSQFALENGVEFIDYNLLLDEINIDTKKDFRDEGNHLNYYGAKKVSNHLADYIAENYTLENRKNIPEYSNWVQDHDEFKSMVKHKKK